MSGAPHGGEVGEWLRIARQDWHRINVMLADEDGAGAGFYLQQSLEKYLKGFLVAEGWHLRKIHALPNTGGSGRGQGPDSRPLPGGGNRVTTGARRGRSLQ